MIGWLHHLHVRYMFLWAGLDRQWSLLRKILKGWDIEE